jgi:hypothetical protein
MKIIDVILLSFAVALFMIGIHQSSYYGIKNSYWIFMISLGCILFLRYRRAVAKIEEKEEVIPPLIETKKNKKKAKK